MSDLIAIHRWFVCAILVFMGADAIATSIVNFNEGRMGGFYLNLVTLAIWIFLIFIYWNAPKINNSEPEE